MLRRFGAGFDRSVRTQMTVSRDDEDRPLLMVIAQAVASSLLGLSSVISMPVVSNTYRIRQKAMLRCSIPKMPSCFSPDHDHRWMVDL